ncbi:uncharacterized protein [Montipora capricornis]|uniref:uncharacterized protein n=1 Tax=Montipora capricornis TaxID=246305 RepID=UPI0035F21AEA
MVNCIKCGEQVAITEVRLYQMNCSIAKEQLVITCDGAKGNIHLLQHPCASNQSPKQDSESLTELNALFPEESEESIREVLVQSGGNTGLAASRLVKWDSGAGVKDLLAYWTGWEVFATNRAKSVYSC